MISPIAGVAPSEISEVISKVVWPTIGATRAGRLVGQLTGVRLGLGDFFTLGKLLALATIPLSIAIFFWQLMPYICRRYVLSNRRIIIRKGLRAVDEKWINLDDFNSIHIEVLSGQKPLHAGDLVFRRDSREIFRLAGVSRPETFRQVCLTAQYALTSVREVTRQQTAGVA